MRSVPSDSLIWWPPSAPIRLATLPCCPCLLDVLHRGGEGQLVGVPLDHGVAAVDLLQRRGDRRVSRQCRRHEDRPELRTDSPGAKPRQVGVRAESLTHSAVAQLEPVEVVGHLLPRCPQQVVVSVDDAVLAQQCADPFRGAHGLTPSRSPEIQPSDPGSQVAPELGSRDHVCFHSLSKVVTS